MNLHFRMGKYRLAPLSKLLTCYFELMKKGMVRIGMLHPFIPSLLNHFLEAGHLDPKVLKAEKLCPRRPLIIRKEKWAVVRNG